VNIPPQAKRTSLPLSQKKKRPELENSPLEGLNGKCRILSKRGRDKEEPFFPTKKALLLRITIEKKGAFSTRKIRKSGVPG